MLLPFRHPERERQDGPPAALLESPAEIRPGIPILPCMLKQTWSDSQIWAQHVPSVLQTICKGHRLYKDGLSAWIAEHQPCGQLIQSHQDEVELEFPINTFFSG
ncbi:hypothetical protein AMEX_G1608 [Astyanax mexicanus]|uniref:Uncharacterized protein n=1 Tax=Astyanax mexicanus TaxID=7994 RepID=A0A8T2MI93_ASTMX|nr:hypothetical protein AMEX_G1608 [Astyanax mexicanus]